MSKAWARKRSFRRKEALREIKPRILIVCEGEKTEPYYFKGFRISSVEVVIQGTGGTHYSVVEAAVSATTKDGGFQEVWCVFDRDKHPGNPNDEALFNQALQLAKENGINVAYSNDAFELWYLLHFNYMDNQISRTDYITKLKKLLGNYKKNDLTMYSKLEDRMDVAIRNAKRLYDQCNKDDPANADPSTTVFILVEKLRSII